MTIAKNIHTSNDQTEKPVLRILFTVTVIGLLIYGWLVREDSYLSATDGLGYQLGIIGGSAILLLLFYPMRKKMRLMRNWGKVTFWFRLHMFLGIIGPVLILFHANFSLGSTNSNLALFSMLLVAGSGVVGRYIYTRIHFGVYGQQASLKEIRDNLQITKGKLSEQFKLSAVIANKIRSTEKRLLKKRNYVLSLFLLPFIPAYTYLSIFLIMRAIKKDMRRQAKSNNWDHAIEKTFTHEADKLLIFYIKNVRRAAELKIYQQLFALWHLLHMPLFITLVLCGIAHVIAVHIY